ncbi:MAG TPA: hypothetical protein V6D03_13755, partial [Candidatus Caenarcaniphilales bacterium]
IETDRLGKKQSSSSNWIILGFRYRVPRFQFELQNLSEECSSLTMFKQNPQLNFWQRLICWGAPMGAILLLALLSKPTTPVLPQAATNVAQPRVPGVTKPSALPQPQPQAVSSQRSTASKPQVPASQPAKQPVTKATTLRQAPVPAHQAPALTLRVAIATDKTTLPIGASTAAAVVNEQGQLLGQIPGGQALVAQADQATLRLGPWQTSGAIWVRPKGGALYIGDRWYRGQVQLTL